MKITITVSDADDKDTTNWVMQNIISSLMGDANIGIVQSLKVQETDSQQKTTIFTKA